MENDKNVTISAEQPTDAEGVFRLHCNAFGGRENESRMVERIRASEGYIPELSLIATGKDECILGHALFSKAEVVDQSRQYEVIVLGPIGVDPSHQKQGIGGSLIREGLRTTLERGYSHVFLIGHPSYYPKFGFQPAGQHGFVLKQFQVPDPVFMVNILNPDVEIKGELRYPQAFFG